MIRKQRLEQADFARLRQKVCGGSSLVCLDEEDLAVLRGGEAAFLWESPLAASGEAAVSMARQAAEMAPEPGWTILGTVTLLIADPGTGLATVDAVTHAVQKVVPKDAALIFGFSSDCEQRGIRFLMAVSEGKLEEGGNAQ